MCACPCMSVRLCVAVSLCVCASVSVCVWVIFSLLRLSLIAAVC